MKYQDAPLLGKRVRAKDGTEGTIVEVGETPKHRLTMFHVRTDDGREAALFSHEFDVLEANELVEGREGETPESDKARQSRPSPTTCSALPESP